MDTPANDGALVVTELIANAVQHTESRLIRVAITRPVPSTVRIDVVDRSRVLPELRARTPITNAGAGAVSPSWTA
jgi:anti-sigma regulatory factor (Ser/Thr protein kinase)